MTDPNFIFPPPLGSSLTGPTSFLQRLIQISITLGQGTGTQQQNTFANTGGANSVTLPFLRTSCRIQNSGSPSQNYASVRVWGMDQQLMNQLSTLGLYLNQVPRNTITISAGSVNAGFTQVYSGNIVQAYGDYNSAPDVPMVFECQFGATLSTVNAPSTSYPGGTSASQAMSGFAGQMGLTFENNGVNTQLPSSYFYGSVVNQARQCAEAANITAEVCDGGQTFAILPKFGMRQNKPQVTIAPLDMGGQMIGYPSFTINGVKVDTIFDPNIAFFGQVTILSSILNSQNSQFVVHKLDLALDSLLPHGEWRSVVYGYTPNSLQPVLTPP